MRLPSALSVLRVREVRLVFSAALVSELGDGLVTVAIAFAVLDATGSATDLGIVLAARTLALVASLLIGGVVADRAGRRSIMITADLTRLITQCVMGVLLIRGAATIAELAVAAAVLGAAGGFFTPASNGLIPDVAGDRLQEALALQGMAMNISSIVGPALSGVAVVLIGAGGTLLIDAGSYGLSALLLARAHTTNVRVGAKQHFIADLRAGFAEVRSRTWLWMTIVLISISNLFLSGFMVLGVVVARTRLGGPGAWSAILACLAAGSLIGGVILLRIKPRRPLVVGVCFCVGETIPSVLLAVPAPVVAIAAATLLAGLGTTVFDTLWNTVLQQQIPPTMRSRVSSYEWFATLALAPLGLALIGPLAGALGISATLYVCAGIQVVCLALTLCVPGVRTIPLRPEGTEVVAEPSGVAVR